MVALDTPSMSSRAVRLCVDKGNLVTIGGELAQVSGLEDPLTSREPTTPHTGCREEETSNSPDMVDKPLTRVLIQRRSAVGVSSVSAPRLAGCRVLSSLASSDLGTVRRLELCKEEMAHGRLSGCRWRSGRLQRGEQDAVLIHGYYPVEPP
jgi:hypothetical protein